MSKQPEYRVVDPESLPVAMARVWTQVQKGLQAGPVIVTLGREGKSPVQRKKYHAMIGDFAKQVEFDGGKRFSAEAWKTLLVEQFQEEMRTQGTPLTHEGYVIPSLDGRRVVQVRPSTERYRKAEARDFVEYLYAYGTELKIRWSEPALKAYEWYRERPA